MNLSLFVMAYDFMKLDSVDKYNALFGLENLHPLANVVDLSKATKFPANTIFNYGIYALFLKNTKCGDIRYGKQTYDYQEGTVVCFAPGQIVETEINPAVKPNATGIVFHPDLIKGTSLGKEIKSYSFFFYNSNEALHLSEEERAIITDCFAKIKRELTQPADKLSRRLIARNIQLLLDYCLRFYERQFGTRKNANRDVLTRFESLLNEYFLDGLTQTNGVPTVKYFAEKVFLSPNYFGDLIKKETGRSPQEYIQNKVTDTAKEMLANPKMTISEVAYELGFQYSQHFNRFFKKNTGDTPSAFRKTLLQ